MEESSSSQIFKEKREASSVSNWYAFVQIGLIAIHSSPQKDETIEGIGKWIILEADSLNKTTNRNCRVQRSTRRISNLLE